MNNGTKILENKRKRKTKLERRKSFQIQKKVQQKKKEIIIKQEVLACIMLTSKPLRDYFKMEGRHGGLNS